MNASFFIDRPVFAWVIALVILLSGGLSLSRLPVAQYPEVAAPALAVTATWPGANAQILEESVTALIEQEMNGIERLLYMDSSSDATGTMTLTLTFTPGTNLDVSSVETQNRIKRVEARLPEEVRRQGIQVAKARRNFLLFVSLYSPDKSLDRIALGSYAAARVMDSLRRVPGVGDAQLFGTEYAMRIWLDPDRMTALGMTPAEVVRAVRAQNIQLALGEIGQLPGVPGQQWTASILTRGQLRTPEEFGDVVVRASTDGTMVRVRDVARVELGAADYSILARLDGQPSAAIGIKLAPDGNALDTASAVRERMGELARYFPPGISWEVPYDASRFVSISIREVLKTLAEAMGLVFLVMYLFLGSLRATLIPAIVVPVSLAGALIGIYELDYSINVLTLFAMVLAIGIVVDDAIVVVENVERIMREEQLSPYKATHKAMGQIVGAIIGITLVLAAVFVPMAFFGGSVGAIYRQFAVTLMLTMFFSALMALTLTPALCAHLLKPVSAQAHGGGWFHRVFERLTQRYQRWVGWLVRRVAVMMALYLVFLVATGWLVARLPTGFLPDEDQGYFVSMMLLPAGATQGRTLELLEQAEQFYMQQPEVAHVVGVAGFSFLGRGQNAALLFTRLKEWDARPDASQSAKAVIGRANQFFAGIRGAMLFAVNVPPIPELSAVGGFDFRLQDRGGVGREALLGARNQMLGLAGQHPALLGVRPEGLEPAPQWYVTPDREKARVLGVDLAELNDTMQSAFGAAYINDFIRSGRILRVYTQANAEAHARPEGLLDLHVRTTSGEMVALRELVTARWQVGSPKLDRYNGVPSMKISGSPAPGRSTGEALQVMEQLAAQLPTGIGFEWSSTSFEERLAGAQAPFLFAVSILVVFLCLAALYESWSIPVAVLLVVPLGVFGATLATMLRGLPNDVYFKVGVIAIIGLSAKNAILIVEFAKSLQDRGMELLEATIEASRMRFRPILMTSIAFVFGVTPLAFSSGAGSASRHAIGTGVMGGMIAATLLAVFLAPIFFIVMRRLFPGRGGSTGPTVVLEKGEPS